MAKRPKPQTPLRIREPTAQRRKPDAAELRRMYHEEMLTQKQIAEKVGYSYPAVKRWFIDYGIPRRSSGWGDPKGRRAREREAKAKPVPEPKRGSRKQVRAWHRLTSTEQKIVARQVDHFLVWVAMKREMEEA